MGHSLAASGLDMTGSQLNTARGISADGRVIVGSGYNPVTRLREGWRVDLGPLGSGVVPEPTQLVVWVGLVLFSAALYAGQNWRCPKQTEPKVPQRG
jgi:hypothetical protein